jgi:hypothetical protein
MRRPVAYRDATGVSRFPRIAAAILLAHVGWSALCALLVLTHDPGPGEEPWAQLIIFLFWTLGELVFAVPALGALAYAAYSWRTADRRTAPLPLSLILVTVVATLIPITTALVVAGFYVVGGSS